MCHCADEVSLAELVRSPARSAGIGTRKTRRSALATPTVHGTEFPKPEMGANGHSDGSNTYVWVPRRSCCVEQLSFCVLAAESVSTHRGAPATHLCAFCVLDWQFPIPTGFLASVVNKVCSRPRRRRYFNLSRYSLSLNTSGVQTSEAFKSLSDTSALTRLWC